MFLITEFGGKEKTMNYEEYKLWLHILFENYSNYLWSACTDDEKDLAQMDLEKIRQLLWNAQDFPSDAQLNAFLESVRWGNSNDERIEMWNPRFEKNSMMTALILEG